MQCSEGWQGWSGERETSQVAVGLKFKAVSQEESQGDVLIVQVI